MTQTAAPPRHAGVHPKSKPYIVRSPWQDQYDHVLVLACSDGRYVQAIAEFIQERFDTVGDRLYVPGGPAAVMLGAGAWFYAVQPMLKLLCGAHGTKHIIAIGHGDCAAYRMKFPNEDFARLAERQLADLRKLPETLARLAPGVLVDVFFAEPKDGSIVISPVLPG